MSNEKANADELATFVASTFRAIATGIEDVQDTKISSAHGSGQFGFGAPESIEFDVAVSAKRSGSADAGLKVAVFGIGANLGGGEASESSTISRIKFSIPTKFKGNEPEVKQGSRYDGLDEE